jgi:hypothetical protein
METILSSLDNRRKNIAAIAEAAATEALRKKGKKVTHMLDFMTGFNHDKLREFLALSFEDRKGHLDYLEQIQGENEKVCFLSSRLCCSWS